MKGNCNRTGSSGGRGSLVLPTLAILAIVGGTGIRIAALDNEGLWHDEFYTLALLQGFDPYLFDGSDLRPVEASRPARAYQNELRHDRFWQNLPRNMVHEGHPPLYFLAARAWCALFGSSPATLRAFSALASLAAVGLFGWLAYRVFGRRRALLVAAIAASMPFGVYFGAEARSYALALALIVACVAIAAEMDLRGRLTVRLGALWSMIAALALYTHYYAAFAVALAAALIVFRASASPLVSRVVVAGLPVLLFVPWLPVLMAQTEAHAGTHWTEGEISLGSGALAYASNLLTLTVGPGATLAERLLAGAALALASARALPGVAASRWARYAVCSLLLLGVGIYVLDEITGHRTLHIYRYAFVAVVPLVLLLGALPRFGRMGSALLGVMLVTFLWADVELASGQRMPRQMIRETAGYLSARADPEDLILVVPSGPTLLGIAYYAEPDLRVAGTPATDLGEAIDDALVRHPVVWLVYQRLDPAYGSPSELDLEEVAEPVRFAGIDLYRIDRAR